MEYRVIKHNRSYLSAYTFFLIVSLFFSVSVKASWQTVWLGNYLVGASVGIGDRKGTFHTTLNYGDFPFFQQTNIDRDISDSGVVFSVLAGYQVVRRQWLMGGELNIDLQAIDEEHGFAFADPDNVLGWNGRMRYQSKMIVGTTGRVGFAVTPYFMPYARLGAEFSRERLSAGYSANTDDFFPPYNVELLISETHWIHRFLLGAGIEFPIPNTCGGTIRLEYDFHSKGRTITPHGSIIDQFLFPSFESGMQPWTKTGKASVIWNIF